MWRGWHSNQENHELLWVFQNLDTNIDFLESKQSYLQFKHLINMYVILSVSLQHFLINIVFMFWQFQINFQSNVPFFSEKL